jgi:ParB family chromosome partitioning protein
VRIPHAVEYRPLAALRPNPLNPRTHAPTTTELTELIASIRAVGLLQPLLVTPDGVIVAGHRRAVAAQAAGLRIVPVLVRALDEPEQLGAMLAENLQRQTLDPVETALACRALRERGMPIEQISVRTGLGRHALQQHLLVLDLPDVVRDLIAGYRLALGTVPHLLRLSSPSEQVRVARRAAEENWLVREVEQAVTALLAPAAPARVVPAERSAAPVSAGSTVSTAPRAGTTTPRGTEPRARVLELFCELVTLLGRQPRLIADAGVRGWIEKLVQVVREAQSTETRRS